MDWTGSFRKAWVVTALTLRYLLTTRRAIATVLLALVPLILTLSLAAARVATFDVMLFQQLMIPLFLQVVLIFVTLVNATALIREEIDDNTLPFLLTRPISKPALVAYKYIGYLVAVLVVLIPPIVVAYGVTEAWGVPRHDDPGKCHVRGALPVHLRPRPATSGGRLADRIRLGIGRGLHPRRRAEGQRDPLPEDDSERRHRDRDQPTRPIPN